MEILAYAVMLYALLGRGDLVYLLVGPVFALPIVIVSACFKLPTSVARARGGAVFGAMQGMGGTIAWFFILGWAAKTAFGEAHAGILALGLLVALLVGRGIFRFYKLKLLRLNEDQAMRDGEFSGVTEAQEATVMHRAMWIGEGIALVGCPFIF
ncbi:MAG: hypothetical protein O3A87_03075 [Verrucomicrobia bacterium]|nr:hypothetical protein [Verrucomicrobiota bacterium]MDA1005447.1 hypothetical protein [Verrucomicrobiota bacterium]